MMKNVRHSDSQLRETIWAQLPRAVSDRLYLLLRTDAYRIKPPGVTFTWALGLSLDVVVPLSDPVECVLERDPVTQEYTRLPDDIVSLLCLTVV